MMPTETPMLTDEISVEEFLSAPCGEFCLLTYEERIIATWVGRKRTRVNRKRGVVNRRVGPKSDEYYSILGFAGEIAFAKIFNIYPDFSCYVMKKHDFSICAYTIDVKTSDSPSLAKPMCVNGKENRGKACDYYALMLGNIDDGFKYHGYAPKEWIFQDRYLDIGGGPETYSYPRQLMRSEAK